eukprot:7745357-Pyramimonas_sp.AAC.1
MIGMADHTGMQKHRLQLKKCKYASESHDACFIRPSNGQQPWDKWENFPKVLSVGLSRRADDASKKRGRQFVHGWPYLPGDNRIQSGLRVDSE